MLFLPAPNRSRKKSIPNPQMVIGRGVLKVKILEAKYEINWNFQGVQDKEPCMEGGGGGAMDILWNCTLVAWRDSRIT